MKLVYKVVLSVRFESMHIVFLHVTLTTGQKVKV